MHCIGQVHMSFARSGPVHARLSIAILFGLTMIATLTSVSAAALFTNTSLNSDGDVTSPYLRSNSGLKEDVDGNGVAKKTDHFRVLSNLDKTVVRSSSSITALTAPPAPINIKAWTGGDSIALVWQLPSGASGVEVYRDSKLVTTLTVDTGILKSDKKAIRYIDKDVTRSTTYKYQLKTINANGIKSPFSVAISATHPSRFSVKTPIPEVVIDNSLDSTFDDFLNTYMVPEIQTWYPKISDFIIGSGYDFRSGNIVLKPDPNCDCVTYIDNDYNIVVGSPYVKEDGSEGTLMHEVTHLIQGYFQGTSDFAWPVFDSIAEWTREWFMYEQYQEYRPHPDNSLYDSYTEGSYMMQWTSYKYKWPNLVHDVNVAIYNSWYTNTLFTRKTGGKGPFQLYTEMKRQYISSEATIKSNNGRCLTSGDSTDSDTDIIRVQSCEQYSQAQQWLLRRRFVDLRQAATVDYQPPSFIISNIRVNGGDGFERCLDLNFNSNPSVQSYTCLNSAEQQWKKGTNGSLVNPLTNKCLTANTDGSLIAIACNGSASQRWITPAF